MPIKMKTLAYITTYKGLGADNQGRPEFSLALQPYLKTHKSNSEVDELQDCPRKADS
jgi:hypothetical protein